MDFLMDISKCLQLKGLGLNFQPGNGKRTTNGLNGPLTRLYFWNIFWFFLVLHIFVHALFVVFRHSK